MSDLTGLVSGLANGLNSYLGTQFQAQNQLAMNKQLIDYQTQRDAQKQTAMMDRESKLEQQKSGDELNRQKALISFKQSQEGQVDAATAEGVAPGSGAMMTAFKQANGRYPHVDEAHQLISASPKHQGMAQADPKDLYTMGQILDLPQDKLDYIKNLKGPVATGLAEKVLGIGEKGISETALYQSFQKMTENDPNSSPESKDAAWTQYRASMMEPGKTAITDEATMNKAVQGVDAVAQQAMKNGLPLTGAIGKAAEVLALKQYDKRTKSKILLRAQLDMMKAHQQAQTQSAQVPQEQLPPQQ